MPTDQAAVVFDRRWGGEGELKLPCPPQHEPGAGELTLNM